MPTIPTESRVAALALSLSVSFAAPAEEFSWQIAAAASRHESSATDFSPALEQDRSALEATYYFTPVDEAAGPLEIAAFLRPSTRISAAVAREDQRSLVFSFTLGSNLGSDVVGDTTEHSVSGRYLLPKSKWYAGGSFGRRAVDNDPGTGQYDDFEGVGVLVGKYVGPRTSIELALNSSEQRNHTRIPCYFGPPCIAIPFTIAYEVDAASFGVAHAGTLRAATYMLRGNVAGSSLDAALDAPLTYVPGLPPLYPATGPRVPLTNLFTPEMFNLTRYRVYSVSGDVFPTTRFGGRVGYSRADGETTSDDAYEFAATWFFRTRIAVQLQYLRARSKGSLPDAKTTELHLIGRF
jgi:hypothetical protein